MALQSHTPSIIESSCDSSLFKISDSENDEDGDESPCLGHDGIESSCDSSLFKISDSQNDEDPGTFPIISNFVSLSIECCG